MVDNTLQQQKVGRIVKKLEENANSNSTDEPPLSTITAKKWR